jgi:hypothetical protein
MKNILIIFSFLFHINASSQLRCEMAVNPNDCHACKLAYKYINQLDSSIEKQIYMGDVDTRTANFFLNNYLKLNEIPNEIDDAKYNALKKDYKTLMKLYDGDSLISEFMMQDLPDHIDKINNLAKANTQKPTDWFLKNINDTIKDNFYGMFRYYRIADEFIFYSALSSKIFTFNAQTGNANQYTIDDQFIFKSISKRFKYGNDFLSNRKFYQETLPEELGAESSISSYAYHNGKVYMVFTFLGYDRMLNQKELAKNNNVVELRYNFFVAEFIEKNNQLELTRLKQISEGSFDEKSLSLNISTYDDRPTLVFKKHKDSNQFYYYQLDSNFRVKNLKLNNVAFLEKYIGANVYVNQYAMYKYSNVMIDNSKNKTMRLSPYLSDSIYLDDFVEYNGDVYLLMDKWNSKEKTLYIYRINFEKQTLEILKKYEKIAKSNFTATLILDKKNSRLKIINMKNDKFNLLDDINLKTLPKKSQR